MPWIQVCANAPYFETTDHENWTPIGQNDAITWPDFAPLFRRKDMSRVSNHMAFLAAHGVTCIRIMMEYCQTDNRYFENPVGRFQTNMIQFWDDLFLLCEQYNIRLLITPFDTFWMKKRWRHHPYNQLNGGPCKTKPQWLTDKGMISAIKERFTFFITRWGGSGALFAWDLWNEIDPIHSRKDLRQLDNFIVQISEHIRGLEMQLYQMTHLQTVSVFAPLLKKHDLYNLIFRNALLDFASIHVYEKHSIDYPKNLIAPALTTSHLIKDVLGSSAPRQALPR
ncbi:hypothetical protein [Dyadobacter luticola]|uniref:Glycoside hydrolase family 5 domain-containing protein n=1 Tax=Dyadobacter luticola TaxID=1979387 RepID=A0A5R9KTR4_9BACT|nr:hypothetical protein [Dyadobacter luticola]TLU99557.1 hypothetical protein FEN17_23675 [Dyadobacter luticola]